MDCILMKRLFQTRGRNVESFAKRTKFNSLCKLNYNLSKNNYDEFLQFQIGGVVCKFLFMACNQVDVISSWRTLDIWC